jgi:AI-2 transport protein TqsA
MPENNLSLLRFLQVAACTVIVAWGIKASSQILVLFLVAMLLAFAMAPLPRWLRQHFKLNKTFAIALSLTMMGMAFLVLSSFLVEVSLRMEQRLPTYEQHLAAISEKVDFVLSANGIPIPSPAKWFTSGKLTELAERMLPTVAGVLSDRLLVWLLSLLFLMEIAENEQSKWGPVGRHLNRYASEVEGYIAIMAKTGAITALANFVLLLALGVDFAVLWCVLYFFLHFIPNLGIFLSMVPPALLALIIFGWQRALLVVVGFLITNAVSDYVLQPKFMKKGLDISFLDVTISLVIWGFLLGPWGGVLAVPLTLAVKKFLSGFEKEGITIIATRTESL